MDGFRPRDRAPQAPRTGSQNGTCAQEDVSNNAPADSQSGGVGAAGQRLVGAARAVRAAGTDAGGKARPREPRAHTGDFGAEPQEGLKQSALNTMSGGRKWTIPGMPEDMFCLWLLLGKKGGTGSVSRVRASESRQGLDPQVHGAGRSVPGPTGGDLPRARSAHRLQVPETWAGALLQAEISRAGPWCGQPLGSQGWGEDSHSPGFYLQTQGRIKGKNAGTSPLSVSPREEAGVRGLGTRAIGDRRARRGVRSPRPGPRALHLPSAYGGPSSLKRSLAVSQEGKT